MRLTSLPFLCNGGFIYFKVTSAAVKNMMYFPVRGCDFGTEFSLYCSREWFSNFTVANLISCTETNTGWVKIMGQRTSLLLWGVQCGQSCVSGTQTTTALPDGIIRSPSCKWQAFPACHANSMDAV